MFDEDRGLFWLGVVVIALAVFLFGVLPAINQENRTCEVIDKDRGGNEGGMRVYTEECGTLAVKDQWFVGQFDSSDLYAQIEPGQTYDFRVAGFRIPLFSVFPNIIEAKEA